MALLSRGREEHPNVPLANHSLLAMCLTLDVSRYDTSRRWWWLFFASLSGFSRTHTNTRIHARFHSRDSSRPLFFLPERKTSCQHARSARDYFTNVEFKHFDRPDRGRAVVFKVTLFTFFRARTARRSSDRARAECHSPSRDGLWRTWSAPIITARRVSRGRYISRAIHSFEVAGTEASKGRSVKVRGRSGGKVIRGFHRCYRGSLAWNNDRIPRTFREIANLNSRGIGGRGGVRLAALLPATRSGSSFTTILVCELISRRIGNAGNSASVENGSRTPVPFLRRDEKRPTLPQPWSEFFYV